MARLPGLSAKDFFKVLQNLGFQKIRQEGSHAFFRHADGRTTVVPVHPGEELDRGLLNKIIKKDLNISRQEFMKNLK